MSDEDLSDCEQIEEKIDECAISEKSEQNSEENNSNSEKSETNSEKSDSESEINEDTTLAKAIPETKVIRYTPSYLSKYEKTRVLGARASQISQNAPIFVQLDPNETDPLEIAYKELINKKLPFIVRRYLPDGSYEDWNLCDLEIV
ncbi:unnamed protein product [Blepharisma stoltei]|uniref:Uncharacterized protein n=1 Tax=Blepharisma stoltei TaxID=1481888 RepID=A0AAU9JX64_9CILI|nr:unnamed protein product [Blepharisma stoltei]